MLAAAFKHALKNGLSRHCDVFKKAVDIAKTVISIMVERLYPTGHLRFAMEANFLYVAYAAAFLTNVRREYTVFLDRALILSPIVATAQASSPP